MIFPDSFLNFEENKQEVRKMGKCIRCGSEDLKLEDKILERFWKCLGCGRVFNIRPKKNLKALKDSKIKLVIPSLVLH